MNHFAARTGVAHKKDSRRTWVAYGLSIVGAVLLSMLVVGGHTRVAITLAFVIPLIALATVHIRAGILAAFVYLVFMGDLRRLLIPMIGWSGQDPLLMVGPVFVIFLAGYAFASRSVQLDTPLAVGVLALMVVMILQIFNPAQGGLIVGVGGALFYLIPLLWFWIGRTYATQAFMQTLLLKVLLPLAVVAAALGYYQTFFGYLPYQLEWYNTAGYTALGSLGIQAPISLFSSSTAYAAFLNIAMVVVLAVMFRKKTVAPLPLFALLFIAMFLIGSRGPVAKLLFTAAGMWAVLGQNKKTWIVRGVFALVLGIAGLTWSLSQVSSVGGNARVEHRVNRQVEGLLGATEEGSSATNHLNMMVIGVTSAFREPLGYGLGATTKAARKFGGNMRTSESDIGDVAISTGLVGLLVYLIIIYLVLSTAVRHWTASRTVVSLAVLGLLALSFSGWLQGGRYAIYPILWLCIGWLDRAANQKKDS